MSRSEIDFETKKEKFVSSQLAKQSNSKKNNQTVNKGSIAYMSKPNVKAFNKAIENRMFNSSGVGRPYAFESVEKLEEDMSEYFQVCRENDIMPTNVTLALWLGVDEDTLTNHANNSSSPFFGVMKRTKQYLHSLMQSGTLAGEINPVAYIFLSKNYYGMRDDKNITVAASNNQSTPNAQETAEALQKQLQEEHITEATISEK